MMFVHFIETGWRDLARRSPGQPDQILAPVALPRPIRKVGVTLTALITHTGALPAPAHGTSLPAHRKPLGKIHSTIRLGDGQWIEIRRGWIDHAEHVGLGTYDNGDLVNGILIPRRALEPLSEAFADIVGFLGLNPSPTPGQGRLF